MFTIEVYGEISTEIPIARFVERGPEPMVEANEAIGYLVDKRSHAHRVCGRKAATIGSTPTSGWQARVTDIVDRALSIARTIITMPLLAAVALAMRLDSCGPALFKQPRAGLHNTMFTMLKFRTMHEHLSAIAVDCQVMCGDQRVIGVGRVLRQTGSDEFRR